VAHTVGDVGHASAQRRVVVGSYRVVLGLVASVAMVAQVADGSSRPAFDVVSFFSYFTILSNLLAIAVLGYLGLTLGRRRAPGIEAARGAAVVYLIVTGVVYALLLADEPGADTLLPWVDTVLHRVMPIALVIDWVLDPPAHPIAWSTAAWWLAFPVAWLAYTLVRGPIVDWYPYPFVDPREGVPALLAYLGGMTVGFVALIVLVTWVGNRARR
jgi:hypothetical protein